MKIKLKMALMCLCAIFVLSLSSCGSKVNQEDLNKKIETAIEKEGLANASFTDAEYEFMAQKVLDEINENREPDAKESEILGEYIMILGVANSQGNLKGNAKKIYDEINNKIGSLMGGDSGYQDSSDFEEDSLSGVEEVAEEVVEDYSDTDAVAVVDE